jgi:hypothetical protein
MDRLCDLVVRVSGYRSRGPGSISGPNHVFWEVVGLERGRLRILSTTKELFGRKIRGSGLKSRGHGRRESRWLRGNLYQQNLALTSPTIDGRSVSIVRSQTQSTEFVQN